MAAEKIETVQPSQPSEQQARKDSIQAAFSHVPAPHSEVIADINRLLYFGGPIVVGLGAADEALRVMRSRAEAEAKTIFADYEQASALQHDFDAFQESEPEFQQLRDIPLTLSDYAAIKYMRLTEEAALKQGPAAELSRGVDAILDNANKLNSLGNGELLQLVAQVSLNAMRTIIVSEETEEMGETLAKSHTTEAHQKLEAAILKAESVVELGGETVGKVIGAIGGGVERTLDGMPFLGEAIKTTKKVRTELQDRIESMSKYLENLIDSSLNNTLTESRDRMIGEIKALAVMHEIHLSGSDIEAFSRILALRFFRSNARAIITIDSPVNRLFRDMARMVAVLDANEDTENSALKSAGIVKTNEQRYQETLTSTQQTETASQQ